MDFVPDRRAHASWGAQAMQSAWLARAYERWWRPVLFAITTGFGSPTMAEEARRVAGLMEPMPGPWLDLSCGPGTLLRQLGHLGASSGARPIVGVDLSLAMLRRARTAAPVAWLVRADAAALPFADGSFGALANLAALDLYPDPQRVVRECARVLAPGGRWVCSTFVAASKAPDRSVFMAASGVRTPTLSELEAWARSAGLRHFGHVLFRRYAVAWADRA